MAEETWRYVLRVDGRDIELLDGEVTLGRSRTATVRVDHESVSRTHAMLTFNKGDAVVNFKVLAPPADRTALIGSEHAGSAPVPALTPDGPVPPAGPSAPEPI